MREILRNLSFHSLRVWQRDADVYFTVWKTEFLPPLLEPILYVFGFGLGLGQLVHDVHYQGRPISYLQFMAPGVLAVAIMFWAFFETTFSSYVRMYYQKTFDAILATPLLVEDVILGELLWGTTKSVIASTIMLGVLAVLGLVSWPTGLWVIPIAAGGGLLFSAFGLIMTSAVKTISQFNVPMFAFILPMFTFAGTFFPLDLLPKWALAVAWCLPLTHLSILVRSAVLGVGHPMIPVSVAYVAVLAPGLAAWSLVRMKRRLIQ
ncbi:MAG: ABC transporter permease [Bacteroidota bacterium]